MNFMFKVILVVILILISIPFYNWLTESAKPYVKGTKVLVKTAEEIIKE